MNGPDVAYSADNTTTGCRNVVIWNVLTGSAALVSGPKASKCGDDTPSGQRVSALAIGDAQVAWVRNISGNTEADDVLFAAARPHAPPHELAAARRIGEPPTSGGWIGGLVGSGDLVAANTWTTNAAGTTTAGTLHTIVSAKLKTVATGTGTVLAESADLGRVAVLHSDGTVALYSAKGALLQNFAPTSPREIALHKDYLVVLTKAKTLEIYNADTGGLVRQWPIPGGAAHVDLYGGIAVYAVWRKLHVLQLTTGKDVVIASLKRAVVGDEIEAPGLVYAYDSVNGSNDLGHLAYIPMRRVTAAVD
jgi:hypothetical protein